MCQKLQSRATAVATHNPRRHRPDDIGGLPKEESVPLPTPAVSKPKPRTTTDNNAVLTLSVFLSTSILLCPSSLICTIIHSLLAL